MLVTETLRGDPFCGDLFVFRSKRSDRVKILWVWFCIRMRDGCGSSLAPGPLQPLR
jgi:transposase